MRTKKPTGLIGRRYTAVLRRRIESLEAENKALKQENESLMRDLLSYDQMKKQIEDLRDKYSKGIQDANEMIKQCREIISAGRSASSNYKKQMSSFLKTLK